MWEYTQITWCCACRVAAAETKGSDIVLLIESAEDDKSSNIFLKIERIII